MKKEILEKIRNIIVNLFVLFIFILIMAITFVSLRVHAADQWTLSSNSGSYDVVVKYYNPDKKLHATDTYTTNNEYFGNSNYFYGAVVEKKDSFFRLNVFYYDLITHEFHNPVFSDSVTLTQIFTDDKGTIKQTGKLQYSSLYINIGLDIDSYETDLPCFGSLDSFKNYCLTGDSSGLLNGGSIDNPDFEDTAYAFTGFMANNKMTATWTGTTERSYLKDEDVEEYVRVSYGFAAKDAPDSIKQVDNDSKEYSTAAKSLTVKVSDLVPDDDSWFLRYVQVIPCYRQAGLGAWGDFYHGESSYVYFNADGSINKIVAPYVKGSLSADMERPVIVLHEAANGNPTESDYSYFEFNNAREDYFFEMKGRWYTTNDFDIYRDKLVWKYKYSTLLKNDLSTWVTVADGKNSVGKFQFDILGKSSWENLITSYPVDDRNYIGGSYALVNKITGYSDAVDTLKMLLKQPYSLYNGYEVYVRYYRYDENGSIEYSKWTHFYNNLANSEGSSGSRLDDLDNMYSENQSDKGLTDDELSDLENTGNSRNDLDAVPKNNYDYSSLETATMNFFDLLTNYGSMFGQFPSMVTAVFGFLPGWLIGLIAVAIGAVIVCRFIGR